MLEPDDPTSTTDHSDASTPDSAAEPQPGSSPDVAPRKRAPRKRTPAAAADVDATAGAVAPRKRAPRKKAQPAPDEPVTGSSDTAADGAAAPPATAAPAKKAVRKRAAKKAAALPADTDGAAAPGSDGAVDTARPAPAMAGVLFMAPSEPAPPRRRQPRAAKKAAEKPADGATAPAPEGVAAADDTAGQQTLDASATDEPRPTSAAPVGLSDAPEPPVQVDDGDDDSDLDADPDDVREAAIEQAVGARRRRRRGRRGRGSRSAEGGRDGDDHVGSTAGGAEEDAADEVTSDADDTEDGAADGAKDGTADDAVEDASDTPASTSRRRRRRRSGSADESGSADDPPNTVVHVRERRAEKHADGDDGVRGVKGSTRLEAKRQRRRDGRETTRRRAPILSEAEFLARREAVDRVMAVRQAGERTQIAVLEDGILVEHYVTRASATSYVGNVYLGRVQNVLPSMEAAFIDIGKGRNGVLYAGEVNWDAAGLEGKSRAIEHALKSGDTVLVQVTKDPIGHKGARLTSQVSLPGRFLVYVPGGEMTGISRRLPDTERHRLKSILKKIVPEDAGVIVRTAAEGASEEDLTRDVERLTTQWASIEAATGDHATAPALVHGEPDLATRVVRDVFNEDFSRLLVEGDEAWDTISQYVAAVAPDLAERMSRNATDTDLFADLRIDEQLHKALERKVWLPSGGSLVIDRTEAMTVIDVNTGKFVGAGGNLEQTVTRNNIEAAEEIVRQLRLRDVGGIVVIDFIDMVLESNRDLVLRRLTECLGRDRTKHQVAEVTTLGLVQMTRKRVGEGLLEAFSETCEVCNGRGVIVHGEPVDRTGAAGGSGDDDQGGGRGKSSRRRRGARSGGSSEPVEVLAPATDERRQAANAAIAAIHRAANGTSEDGTDETDGSGGTGGTGSGGSAAVGSRIDELASGLVAAAESEAAEVPDVTELSEPDEVAAQLLASVAVVENGAQPPPAEPPADSPTDSPADGAPRRRRRAASRPAGPPAAPESG